MKRIYVIAALAALSCAVPSAAQTIAGTEPAGHGSIESVLHEVEGNNTTLEALRQTAEAQKLENRTGIMLDDPEIGFSYLWGGPAAIGNRQDVSVTQNFDFGTVSGLKSKVAAQKNELVEWQYKADRMNILLEAKLLCIDLIYWNALIESLETRLANAGTIAESQRARLEHGEGNILEYNNITLDLASVRNEVMRAGAERDAVLSQLAGLNGGKRIEFSESGYEPTEFPASFEAWYSEAEAKNPILAYARQEIEVSRRELSLSRTGNLPSLSVGYMGEFTLGQRYQGVSLGLSVPLWSNARRVRQAKAAVLAAQARESDAKRQFYSTLETQYLRASALKSVAENSRGALGLSDNSALLKKAMESGEISVPDYLVGLNLYYDALMQTLEAERDYQKAYAELKAFEL